MSGEDIDALEYAELQRQTEAEEIKELRSALRYLFYMRTGIGGDKVEEILADKEPERWREIYKLLAEKS